MSVVGPRAGRLVEKRVGFFCDCREQRGQRGREYAWNNAGDVMENAAHNFNDANDAATEYINNANDNLATAMIHANDYLWGKSAENGVW